MEKGMVFADKLKKLRKEKGWSQDKLSKIVNIHVRLIGKYEARQIYPTAETLTKLAKAFCVSIDYLLLDEITDTLISSEIKDRKLLGIFKELSKMNDKDKEIIIPVLDAFIEKNKIKK